MHQKAESRRTKTSLWIHVFFVIFALLCIVPFMIVLSASLSSTDDLIRHGFSVLPRNIDLMAYRYLFANPGIVINAYGVTIFITVTGTSLSVLFMSMAAYCLARKNFRFKKILTIYIFFPTLFSGGLVSSYIINTQYLKLADNLWALILPGLVNVFHLIMIRTFFKQLPDSLFEAAKIDGAGEYMIFFRIALSLSKPVLATAAFLGALSKWNEWYNAMLYIRNTNLYPIQYLLQKMLMSVQALVLAMQYAPSLANIKDMPGENLRMALLIVSIGPTMLFFPFFQKYFIRGLTVGSVKG